MLEHHADALCAADIVVLEQMLRESRTWALSDSLAASVVGPLVEREPSLVTTLDRWSTDEDFWLRRAAMLALLLALRRGEGDFELFGRYADAMLDDKEFFIRKAIGWALRDYARTDPQWVRQFVDDREQTLSALSTREARKHL